MTFYQKYVLQPTLKIISSPSEGIAFTVRLHVACLNMNNLGINQPCQDSTVTSLEGSSECKLVNVH